MVQPPDDTPPPVDLPVVKRRLKAGLRRWSARLGLVGLGVVMGVESAPTWNAAGVGFLAIAVLVATFVAFSIEAEREIEAEVGPGRAEQKAAWAVAAARRHAAEIRQDATDEAERVRTDAQREAQLIVERARTAAMAIDPAAERQPRVRRPDRTPADDGR